jgi:hypothetical protein
VSGVERSPHRGMSCIDRLAPPPGPCGSDPFPVLSQAHGQVPALRMMLSWLLVATMPIRLVADRTLAQARRFRSHRAPGRRGVIKICPRDRGDPSAASWSCRRSIFRREGAIDNRPTTVKRRPMTKTHSRPDMKVRSNATHSARYARPIPRKSDALQDFWRPSALGAFRGRRRTGAVAKSPTNPKPATAHPQFPGGDQRLGVVIANDRTNSIRSGAMNILAKKARAATNG